MNLFLKVLDSAVITAHQQAVVVAHCVDEILAPNV